jgi:DNA-binding LytR/AlgR family response regulator
VAIARNGLEAAERIAELRPDIAFLDIQMPGLTGLEVAAGIEGLTRVVFVTAYDEYALTAFDAEAIDYVLKPVTAERISKVVERLRGRIAEPPASLAMLLHKLMAHTTGEPLRWLKASLGASMRLIAVDDVLYFHAEDKYTRVVTADCDALIRKSIKELGEELDASLFWQVHRATIVNVRAIARVDRDDRDQPLIRIKGRGEPLTVSRTFAHLFKAM